ncbi:segregation and condensation protein A [Geomicrobium halophilum]|uniref:Segregation and condensation protein A n=1 Tax=Geomicrobium halophilum TaxID=549000 RepID=A0A841PXS7_9BACL|nr:segregation/condensation protein A [Geomicrobium halophilum]MBB6448982.1 segregation and condensation protein A [Geomicrobium halophilum]
MQVERYSVKLDSFEGPLDLLLHLIQQAEVDIYDIPVAKITEQYMTYIHTMQELELDVASEYLVMASTLLAIKSQMLLPKQDVWADEDWELEDWGEEDPREELVAQLETYLQYKEIASELRERHVKRSHLFTKPPSRINTESKENMEHTTDIEASLSDLLQAYQHVYQRLRFERPHTATVETQRWTVESKMETITTLVLERKQAVPFLELYKKGQINEQVTTFMALLQLVKDGSVICKQEKNFADIYIEPRGDVEYE